MGQPFTELSQGHVVGPQVAPCILQRSLTSLSWSRFVGAIARRILSVVLRGLDNTCMQIQLHTYNVVICFYNVLSICMNERVRSEAVVLFHHISLIYTLSWWYGRRKLRKWESRQFGYNLRYTYDTGLCANSLDEAERLIGKVNNIGKARLLKLNVKQTKLLKIGKMQELQWTMNKLRWSNISNISAHWNQVMAIVAKTPDPELEWPRKECSILYRSGKTEE